MGQHCSWGVTALLLTPAKLLPWLLKPTVEVFSAQDDHVRAGGRTCAAIQGNTSGAGADDTTALLLSLPLVWQPGRGEGLSSPPRDPPTLGLGARALAEVGGVQVVWIFERGQASERGGFAGGCTSWF